MKYYRLIDIENGDELYVNPNIIDFYIYTNKGVLIHTNKYTMHVDKSDFTNMMIIEGVNEYWQLLLTVFQSTLKIKLSYCQNH